MYIKILISMFTQFQKFKLITAVSNKSHSNTRNLIPLSGNAVRQPRGLSDGLCARAARTESGAPALVAVAAAATAAPHWIRMWVASEGLCFSTFELVYEDEYTGAFMKHFNSLRLTRKGTPSFVALRDPLLHRHFWNQFTFRWYKLRVMLGEVLCLEIFMQ